MASTKLEVQTPMGPCKIDMQDLYDANQSVKVIGSSMSARQRLHEDWCKGKASEKWRWFSQKLGLLMLSELPRFLAEQQLVVRMTTHFVNCGNTETDPAYTDVKVDVDTEVQVPSGCTLLVESQDPEKTRLVISIFIDSEGDTRLSINYNQNDEEAQRLATTFHADFERFFIEHGPLNGSVFTGGFSFLPRDTGASAKIVLSSEVNKSVDRHITGFIRVRGELLAQGQEVNRGIILAGAPGTGKTLLIRSIIEQNPDQTVIVMSPEHAAERGKVAQMIKMASNYAPSILVLEDIDNGVGIHRNLRDHPILAEFLNSMDGVARNNGIFTIASTNYLDRMDPALRDRPGRFCRVIQVPVPNQECRHRLLSNLATEFGFDLTYKQITSFSMATDGLTGDWLREIARTAQLIAIQDGRDSSISYDDLRQALRDVNDNRGVAHRDTPVLEPPVDSSKISDVYI